MSMPVQAERIEMHIAEILPVMAEKGLDHFPVVDGDGRLVGMLAHSDLVAAMFSVSGSPQMATLPKALQL